jgi:hypothetical protein
MISTTFPEPSVFRCTLIILHAREPSVSPAKAKLGNYCQSNQANKAEPFKCSGIKVYTLASSESVSYIPYAKL